LDAAAAGTWRHGDRTVNRLGFGAMRLTRSLPFGVNHSDTAAGTGAPRLLKVARRHGATTAQVRLAWALEQAPNVLVIPGTGSPAHLEENIAAASLRLNAEDLALLDAAR
jgi:predicted oxidoreductase